MKIIATRNYRGKWFWKIVASNGRILAHSEDYKTKAMCLKTATKILSAKIEVQL